MISSSKGFRKVLRTENSKEQQAKGFVTTEIINMVKECCCFELKTGSILIGILDLIKDSIIICLILNKLNDDHNENLLRYQLFLILSAITITSSVLLIIGVKWAFVRCIEVWLVSKAVVSFTIGLSSLWIISSGISSGEKNIYQGVVMLALVISYVIGMLCTYIFNIWF